MRVLIPASTQPVRQELPRQGLAVAQVMPPRATQETPEAQAPMVELEARWEFP